MFIDIFRQQGQGVPPVTFRPDGRGGFLQNPTPGKPFWEQWEENARNNFPQKNGYAVVENGAGGGFNPLDPFGKLNTPEGDKIAEKIQDAGMTIFLLLLLSFVIWKAI